MITTFKEIVASQGWEIGKMVETDIWVGAEYIRHVTKAMLIKEDVAYFEYDKLFFVGENSSIFDEKGSDSYHYGETKRVSLTYSSVEAIQDAKLLTQIREEEYKKNIDAVSLRIKELFEKTDVKNFGYWEYKEIADKLKLSTSEEFNSFRRFVEAAGYVDASYSISGDTEYELKYLFRRRSFNFEDVDNGKIETFVNLDHVVSVETDCTYKEKSCIALNMDNGETYRVYKEEHEDLYKALRILYN